ncbi:hypothetical protein JCM16303_004846 [Sporobolomyces ruberrimus]
MSNWRGGSRPPSFPSQSASTQSGHSSSSSTFPSFNPSASSPFALSERGRGRGGIRGRGGGPTWGLPSKRGGGANLSWKRPTEPTATIEGQTSELEGQQPPQSAFGAFGSSNAQGGRGGNAFAFGSTSTATSAFGSSGGSAFGSSGTFGATPTSTAFSQQSPAFAPTTNSAFGSSSTFGSTPFQTAVPSHSEETTQEEEEEEHEEEEDQAEEAEEEEEEEQVEPETKRNPAQISTLEVLGEDSDARRKRFESTLPNNRYLELKPLREEQRLRAIKQGLIPDPSKPMRLDQATDFEGTCMEMCPEWEREEREYQNNVDPLERYPGTSRIDPSRAVKAFHRPAAGNDQPLPSDVRPPRMLYKTLDYLFHTLLPQHSLATTHPFVRDRTRSVRQDFTVQNVRGESAVECNERIARYHILALGTLREQSGFSESQELEQLRKVLKSLNEFYDDLRFSHPDLSLPNEAEFRSYHLLTHLRDPDIIWSTELLPPHVFSHPLLQTALELHRLSQKSNTSRGERASPNAFSRFFKLVESDRVPYLFGCILSTHFGEIRRNALESLKGAYLKQHSAFPVRTLTKVLGCDDEKETRELCEELGVVVRTDERGKLVAELHKGVVIKSTTLKLRVSRRLVEGKRGSTIYQQVIDGSNYSSRSVAKVPSTPTLAPPSTSSFPSASQASSAPRPKIPAFSGFGTSTPTSRPSTAFPTPAPTPPPPTTFSAPPSKPSLDAGASPFVPSFGAQTASTAPPPSFSFASSSAPAPPPSQPSLPQSAPSFSFAPTASVFVPSSAPPQPTAPAPQPNFFSAAPPSQPPNTSAPTVAAKPALKPLSPAHSPNLAPSASVRRISSTHSRLSSKIVPSRAPTHPTSRLSPPKIIKKKPIIDRQPLIDSLTLSLTRALLSEAIQGPVRRIGSEVSKERWNELSEVEEKEKKVMGDRLGETVLEEIGKLFVKEIVVSVKREERLRREVLGVWRERTKEREKRRVEGEERKREWEDVVKGLATRGRRTGTREDEEDEYSDDELVVEEEEDLGLAGSGDVDFELGGLSISLERTNQRVVVKEAAPEDMAEKLRIAAETRQRIWANSTFLNILASNLALVSSSRQSSPRTPWTTLVSTPSTGSSFATWLSCKFGLDETDRRARLASVEGEVVVQMFAGGEEVEQDDLDSTGLIVFDCTALPGSDFHWDEARETLKALVADIERDSLYRPALLVLVCPSRTLGSEEADVLRQSISKDLDLSALSESLAASSVMIVKLDEAEASFVSETTRLLSSTSIREERIRRPLALFSKPLLASWRTSVRTNLERYKRADTAPTVVATYISELQEIVTEIEAAVHPPLSSPVSVPSFPDNKGSFRSAVDSYVSSREFASAGNFPEIAAAFAQRPPISDYHLARLLLDLLDHFAKMSYSPTLTTLQISLDETLRPTLQRVEDSLIEASQLLRESALEIEARNAAKENEPASTKKRKASISPTDSANRSPKKASVAMNGHPSTPGKTEVPSHDRLTALECLMTETKALLSA